MSPASLRAGRVGAAPRGHLCRGLLAGFAVALCAGAAQPAGAAALGGKQVICDEIRQRYTVQQTQLYDRTLNFLLFDAAERGCLELAETFVAAGASIQARDRFGNTALLIAARMGENALVEWLLGVGSDLHHRNLAGSTALLGAVTQNRRRTAKLLLEAGADPNAANTRGVTPLIAATFNGNGRLVDMLLRAGADPMSRDATGKGAMVYAAGKGFAGIVALLLDAGVAVDARYQNDLTALIWAAGHSNEVPESEGLETVRLLIDRGARPDLVDNRGRTALMVAAERGHGEIVSYLLASGSDAARRDGTGLTAADLAADDGVRRKLMSP